MKIAITSDWHLGSKNYGVIDSNGMNSRLQDFVSAIMKSIKNAVAEGCSLYICPGDIFHTNKPSVVEQRAFYQIIRAFETARIQTRFIIGNHDFNGKLGECHALKLFMDITRDSEYVKIYDDTTWEDIAIDDGKKTLRVCYFPYHAEEPVLSPERSEDVKIALVCHSHLEGAVVGAEPFEIKSDKATKFKDLPVDYIIAGHFHKPQLLSEKPLAFYPGSICPVDFNERNDIKGMVILDAITGEYRCIAIPTRRLIQIEYDLTNSSGFMLDENIDLVDAIVKVKIKMTKGQSSSYEESDVRTLIMKLGAHSIASINLEIEKESIQRNAEIKIQSNLFDSLRSYLSSKDFGDKSDLIRSASEGIINESLSS